MGGREGGVEGLRQPSSVLEVTRGRRRRWWPSVQREASHRLRFEVRGKFPFPLRCPQQALQIPRPLLKLNAFRGTNAPKALEPRSRGSIPTHQRPPRNDLRSGADCISHKCNTFREKQLSQGGVPFSAAWSFQVVFGNESNSCLP